MHLEALLILAITFGAAPDKDLNNKRAVGQVRAIRSSTWFKPQVGTGFLLKLEGPDAWVVTCAHVVRGAQAIRVDFSEFEWFAVEEVHMDEAHDLALLRLEKKDLPAEPFVLRTKPATDDEKYKITGFLRGVGPHKPTVEVKNRDQLDGKFVGLPAESSRLFDPKTQVLEVEFAADDGASGSVLVDSDGHVAGVFFAAWKRNPSIGYCVSSRYLASFKSTKSFKTDMSLKDTRLALMDEFEKFQLELLRDPRVREMMAGAPAASAVIGIVPKDQIFDQFFKSQNHQQNEAIRKQVEASVRDSQKKINHVVNTTLGVGFLVPEGYVLKEMLHDKTGGYTLMISRPGSHYRAYVYARRVNSIPSDKKKEQSEFNLEVLNYLSDVPGIAPTNETLPGPGKAVIGPGSWPAIYRDQGSEHQCLITFRTYFEPARGSFHTYGMELCHRNNRFEVAGITFPLNAFVEENDPSEEYLELELIASSLYDLELGLEKTKRLHESKNLVAELELPTPTPEARPDNFSPQLADTFPTPPNGQPGDRRIVLRPPQPAPIPPQPQPQPVPPQPAPPREIWAANVGIHYEMVQHPNGGIGARITRVPPMGSPASQIWVWGQLGWLQPNDIILAVDGIPIQRVDFAQHFGQTRIDFIDGPTGLTLTGIMLLP